MIEKKDLLEEMLNEEFARLAKEEENAVQKEDIGMLEEVEEDIYTGIQEKIQEMEREKQKDYLYAQLSEEDLRALELGRKIMEREAREERDGKIIRKKKRIRMFIGLAAALVMAMGVGVTSMGGPERIVKMLTQVVGNREIEKITSSDDVITTVEENEEEAYQKIEEEFGVKATRIFLRPDGLEFSKIVMDDQLQIAELIYRYKQDTVIFFINASYKKTSLGIDIEDEVVDTYEKKFESNEVSFEVEMKEYKVIESGLERYSAQFEYKGLEYFLVGTMNKEEFEYILRNLYFYN